MPWNTICIPPPRGESSPELFAGRKGSYMPKILIVEDAQDQLELFAKTFRRAGFDVYGAHDGGHAMDRVRDVKPDIILLDQMMPEVDGITFLQNLRRFPKWKNTPFILDTAPT